MNTISRLSRAIATAEEGGNVTLSKDDAIKLLTTVAGLAVDPPRRYRHYKGPVYELICEATFEADEQPMVVYRAPNGTLWIRYKNVFEEMINVDGRQMQRFSPIEE